MFRELDFIDRKNGYIDLDSYLLEKYGTVNIKQIAKTQDIIEDGNFYWLTINNQKYMFKSCTEEEGIKEILASEMLNYVGYDHAEYDLASINGEFGVITRNLKKDYYRYYSGEQLISDYHEYIDDSIDTKNDYYESRFNNLSDIWDMLELKYNSYPNKNSIIKKIMDKLVEKFMFDILICQWDGASYNWIIEESENNATLFPLHDHQKMLDGLNLERTINSNIKVEEFDVDQRKSYDNIQELKKFLNYSSEYYLDEFKRLLISLTPNNIKFLLIGIENNLSYKISTKIKNIILYRYGYVHESLVKVLEEEQSIKR